MSKRTIVRLENGQSSQVTNLLRVLRALGLLGDLDALVPAPLASPIEALEGQGAGSAAAPSPASKKPKPSSDWTWGDDKPTAGVNREHRRRGSDVGTADRRGFHRRSRDGGRVRIHTMHLPEAASRSPRS